MKFTESVISRQVRFGKKMITVSGLTLGATLKFRQLGCKLAKASPSFWASLPSLQLGEMQTRLVQKPHSYLLLQVRSLGWEDPLQEGTATHYRILAWRIPWTEELGGVQSTRSQRVKRH